MSDSCTTVHRLFNKLPILQFPFDTTKIPQNGIYILFEKGEEAHGGRRIVRVGTHTGKDQLRSRLLQHFVKENKDRSIFRKNIGRALLRKAHDPFLSQWELDLTPHDARIAHQGMIDTQKLNATEKNVTQELQRRFSFVVFPVEDRGKRLALESKIISTISSCEACEPSTHWLGLHSPKKKIRKSGLWLVNELYEEPLSAKDMMDLKRMLGK